MKFIKNYFTFSLLRLLKRNKIPKSGCLHVGANYGSELDSYKTYGFENVVWIEGYKPFYEVLLKNIKNEKNHIALNYMISEKNTYLSY